ncbi:MAG: radical SAM protein [Bacteriovoracaceae bacterium]
MVQVHLLSLPWGLKHIPSIQIAGLKAYLRRHRPEHQVYAHHFHFSIPSAMFSEERYWSKVSKNLRESYYLYLLAKRYGHRFQLPDAETLYQDLYEHARNQRQSFEFLTREEIDQLGDITERFLEEKVVGPARGASKLVIGMTTNFLQTYANVFAYAYLEERLGDKERVYVLGGSSVSYPQIVSTLARLRIRAHAIIGEGETKLVKFIDQFVANANLDDHPNGVFSLEAPIDLTTWDESWYKSQVKSFADLPDPDFSEYFEALDHHVKTFDGISMRKIVELPLEGSRGCVFSCEFCNLNRFWEGYRKRPGQEIAQRALALSRHYGVTRIRFVDNLCDGWARDYAEELVKNGEKVSAMMELRPKHDESFWEALKKSGLRECQIGVEGLDDDILKRVKKGTTVMDVAFNQKLLTEKLIFRGSRQIISFYPKSTVEEVANTRQILELLLHMPRFDVYGFSLGVDSPLYKELSRETQKSLHVTSSYASALPKTHEDLSVHFYLENPPEVYPTPEGSVEWRKLLDWYREIPPYYWAHHCLTIEENKIRDGRSGQEIVYDLTFLEFQVYGQCHSPITLEKLREKTNLSGGECEMILASLFQKKLLFESKGHYLALALRISHEDLQSIRKQKFFLVTH